MKKCPFCNAELEENSSFCIYCMTSLDNKEKISSPLHKRKSLLPIIIFIVLVIIIALICLAIKGNINNTNNKQQTNGESVFDSITTENTSETTSSVETTQENSSSSTTIPGEDISTTDSTTTTSPEETETTTNSDIPDVTTDGATYIYREARRGDDFSASYIFPEDAIVITDVTIPAKDGFYFIPSEIDGKPVVAIMGNAFCNDNVASTVKKVVVPSSVKTIWSNAFAKCYNLTDIYFEGNSIYVENSAFADTSQRSGTLTIHCSANCNDRNLRYYKNSAVNYDAQFKEWNGGIYDW